MRTVKTLSKQLELASKGLLFYTESGGYKRANTAKVNADHATVKFYTKVSAWDAARFDYGCIAFDQLTRWEQIAAVRKYVGREVSA